MEDQLQALTVIVDTVVGFVIASGFQIPGVLVVPLIGPKVSSRMAETPAAAARAG